MSLSGVNESAGPWWAHEYSLTQCLRVLLHHLMRVFVFTCVVFVCMYVCMYVYMYVCMYVCIIAPYVIKVRPYEFPFSQ